MRFAHDAQVMPVIGISIVWLMARARSRLDRVVAGLVDRRDHRRAIDARARDAHELGLEVDLDGAHARHLADFAGHGHLAVVAAHAVYAVGEVLKDHRVSSCPSKYTDRGYRWCRRQLYPPGVPTNGASHESCIGRPRGRYWRRS